MKNLYSSAWVFAALTLTCSAAQALGPVVTNVIFTCPCVDTVHMDDYVLKGSGTELIANKNNPIQFSSIPYLPNIPPVLFNYEIAGIHYNSIYGIVSCDYQSSNENEGAFSLNYQVTNGTGGTVQAVTNYSIMIGLPFG